MRDRMKLAGIIRVLKANSGQSKLRIDRASPDLVAEAMVMGASHEILYDSQTISPFHHYTLKSDNVEVTVITTHPPDEQEAKAAAYAGYSLEEYRRMEKRHGR